MNGTEGAGQGHKEESGVIKCRVCRRVGSVASVEHRQDGTICTSASGAGELQRVHVAAALARDADIYLLDEPCAFLDVRQRLSLAKILKNFGRPVVIVEHDIMFISYVADSLVVFTGEEAVHGMSEQTAVSEGMNKFLKHVGITFRTDPETGRPRPNKPGSQKDREQRSKGTYYDIR